MHDHPDPVMHAVTNGSLMVTSATGETSRSEIKGGATFWTPATTHAVENVGSEGVHSIGAGLK
jgi:hypothetical protein